MPDAMDYQYTFRVKKSSARVRSRPTTGTGSEIIGSVPPDATVYSNEVITGFDRLQWVKVTTGITLEDGTQLTKDGFIRKDLLEMTNHKVPTGYTEPTPPPIPSLADEYQRGYAAGMNAAYQKMALFLAGQQGA
jgi:hypothetical protein